MNRFNDLGNRIAFAILLLLICLCAGLAGCGGGGTDEEHEDPVRTIQPVDCSRGACR